MLDRPAMDRQRSRPGTGQEQTELGVGNQVLLSPDKLLANVRAVQARRGLTAADSWILEAAFNADRAAPMVTVLDGHPHTLAFLAGINRVPAAHLGVTAFGQSGDPDSVYRYHHIDADSVISAALDLIA